MTKKNWFLLQYKPNSHIIAKKNLERQGFNVFLPYEEKIKKRYNRSTHYLCPLFLGYMFIEFELHPPQWIAINSTPGVTRLLSQNKAPRSVPDHIILELINRCDKNGKLLKCKRLKAGDKIKLINSPFDDLITNIEKVDCEQRIWILMNILGRSSLTCISEKQVHLLE